MLETILLNTNISFVDLTQLAEDDINVELLKDTTNYHKYFQYQESGHSDWTTYSNSSNPHKDTKHSKTKYTEHDQVTHSHKEFYDRTTGGGSTHKDHCKYIKNGSLDCSDWEGSLHKNFGVHWNIPNYQESTHHNQASHDKHYSQDNHSETVNTGESHTKHANFPHSDHSDSHTNNSNVHSESGFNHVNYIPSKVFFNLENGEKIRAVSKIMFFAVDGNKQGKGSQDFPSKDVRYTVKIRRLSDLKGNSKVSPWRTLINESDLTEFNLNTIDPLNQGITDWEETEGLYEIEAFAKNPSKSEKGVTKNYVGEKSRVIFTIQQNYLPKITITNGENFIDYTFGEDSKRTVDGVLGEYLTENSTKGIPIHFVLTDQDLTNTHKAWVTIVDKNGVETIGRIETVLSNERKDSDKVYRDGFVVIPKENIDSLGEKMGSKIKIIVHDFLENGNPTGSIVEITQEISENPSSKYLKVDIDTIAPRVTFSEIIPEYKQFYNLRTFVEDNEGSGITKVEYQILKNEAAITEENWITQHEQNTKGLLTYDFDTRIEEFGNFKVAIRVTDYVDNKRVIMSDVMNIAPITESKLSILPKYPSSLPASEMFNVKVEYLCDLELHEPVIRVKTKSGAPFVMDFTGRMEKTTSTNGKQVFKIQVPVDKRVHDGDLDFEVFTNRKDTAFDNNTVDVRYTLNDKGKIFTPINLERANSPTIVADRDTVYLARTTKYVEDTKIKLYIGTPNETGWIPMTAEIQPDGSKVWGYATTTPSSIQSNQIYQIKSTLPTGKFEDLEYQAAYLKVDSVFEHTDEWLERLKGYNRWKSGNENTPRSLDIYFAGENLVIKTETDSDTDTPVTEVGFRLFKEDRTEITTDKILLSSKSRNIIGELVRENWEVNSNVLSLTKNNQNIGKTKLEKLYVILYVTVGDVVEYEYFIEVDDSDGAFKGYREW